MPIKDIVMWLLPDFRYAFSDQNYYSTETELKIHETTHTGETYGQSPKTLKRGEGWKFDEGDQKVEDSDEEPQPYYPYDKQYQTKNDVWGQPRMMFVCKTCDGKFATSKSLKQHISKYGQCFFAFPLFQLWYRTLKRFWPTLRRFWHTLAVPFGWMVRYVDQ